MADADGRVHGLRGEVMAHARLVQGGVLRFR